MEGCSEPHRAAALPLLSEHSKGLFLTIIPTPNLHPQSLLATPAGADPSPNMGVVVLEDCCLPACSHPNFAQSASPAKKDKANDRDRREIQPVETLNI